jgi:LuxR family maltose regulon positive regulatory protein
VSYRLLATKIHIPPLRSNLVSRPHLIKRLNDGITQNHRLTLISAPAGYGKSTLLIEWVSQLDTQVSWVSLEKEENNPLRFWSRLALVNPLFRHYSLPNFPLWIYYLLTY